MITIIPYRITDVVESEPQSGCGDGIKKNTIYKQTTEKVVQAAVGQWKLNGAPC